MPRIGQLGSGGCGLVSVMLRMKLGCFRRVVGCVVQVTLRRVRVVSCCLMVAGFVMLRRFHMMLGGLFVVMRRFVMVFRCFLRHICSPFLRLPGPRELALF